MNIILSFALFSLLFYPSLAMDCSIAPLFGDVMSSPKGTGLRIDRKASVLFTPIPTTSIVTIRFGMQAKESSLLFQVKLEESKTKYHLPANHSHAVFVDHLVVHQQCTRPFLELVIIPRCNLSEKFFFMSNSGDEVQYKIRSYDILSPTASKVGRDLIFSAEIIECQAVNLNSPGYFISHSFPVFLLSNNFVRVPARVVSRINKTRVIYVITYRISNETIIVNNKIPSAITIAYEASQRALGVHLELSLISQTLGISWIPTNQIQRNGRLLRFRYTFLRNESRDLTALEVHLSRQLTWRGGRRSLLMRVMLLPHSASRSWWGFHLPSTHSAFRTLRHMISTTEGDLQMLEVGLVPDDSCTVPMIFHVLATSTEGRQRRQATAFFESASLRSFEVRRRSVRQKADVWAEIDFCSPRLDDKAPLEVRWRLGLSNWTVAETQSKQLGESSLQLTLTFPVLLRCMMQNLSLAIAGYDVFRFVLDEVLSKEVCEASIRWSVVTTAGVQLQDLTWIRRHEPFFLRLDAHFPYFFTAKTLLEVEIPRRQQMTFQRLRFKPDGEILRLRQQWQMHLNDCNLFTETFRARILDNDRPMAFVKMVILPQFCRPRITEFKVLSQSTNGGQLAISCRIETAAPLNDASWGIHDIGKPVKDPLREQKGTVLMIGAAINFSSCEGLRLRAVVCWFRQRGLQIVFRPLVVQDAFCEGPMLYFLFLVCGVLPIIGFLYLMIALRGCLLNRKQTI